MYDWSTHPPPSLPKPLPGVKVPDWASFYPIIVRPVPPVGVLKVQPRRLPFFVVALDNGGGERPRTCNREYGVNNVGHTLKLFFPCENRFGQ